MKNLVTKAAATLALLPLAFANPAQAGNVDWKCYQTDDFKACVVEVRNENNVFNGFLAQDNDPLRNHEAVFSLRCDKEADRYNWKGEVVGDADKVEVEQLVDRFAKSFCYAL